MDCYIIPPLGAMELMNQGNRFFCLAQLYKKSEDYREFFKEKARKGKWITLDNGAGDHDMVSAKDLFEIMADLKPSEVIPPDVLLNGIQTIRNLETFTRSMYDAGFDKTIEVLGCPQGANKEEWLFVYKYMLNHPIVKTIGMSKLAIPLAFLDETNDKRIMEARHLAWDTLGALGLRIKPMHFLGMGDPNEFKYYKGSPIARSTDSCNTVWSAINGIEFEIGDFERIPTPKDYFDKRVHNMQYGIALKNINWFKKELAAL